MRILKKSWRALPVGLTALLLWLSLALASGSRNATVEPLVPDDVHAEIGKTIAKILPQFHYNHQKINDAFSAEVLDLYLERLDPGRLYFLASDVAQFARYRFVLDDQLKMGELGPPFEIFNRFKQRAQERIAFALQALEKEFDFNEDEYYEVDRSDAPWAASVEELNALWQKKLKNEALNLKLTGKAWPDLQERLVKRYKNFERRIHQYNNEDVFRYYMNAVSEIYDPHTAYFSPITAENFGIDMSLKFQGIGAQLTTEDEYTKVVRILPGGPAERSKALAPNDRIIGVAQGEDGEMLDVVGMRLDDVVQKIRGPKGSVVRLLILPASATDETETKEIRLVRDEIILEERAAKAETVELTHEGHLYKIGVINIPSFYADLEAQRRGERDYKRTTTDVMRLLQDLQAEGVDGVLIDLRGNGGGSLQEAIELTGLFIKDGPVVQVRESRGYIEVKEDEDDRVFYDGPLAVLVDRTSASASEIFAAAIQDYGRGVIIGSPTFGKGTVQSLYSLERFPTLRNQRVGQLKVTIAKFYRVTGSSTQHRGVVPDIVFPSLYDEMDYGESKQAHALPWDEIRPARFSPDDRVSQFLAELRLASRQRTEKNLEFQHLREDIERFRAKQNQKAVSLNEAKRRAEREAEQAQKLTRANERRAAKGKPALEKGEKIPEEDTTPDYILDESEHILADLVELTNPNAAPAVAKTGDKKDAEKKKSSRTATVDGNQE